MSTTTTTKAVLAAVKTTFGKQSRTAPKTACRHPPTEQSILIFEDRVLHGCEWCGELLNRRPNPIPKGDVPDLEYEALRELRCQ